MKLLIIGACFLFVGAGAAAQTGSVQQRTQEQETMHQVDQNKKAITLMTVAVTALSSFCTALLVYIRKAHAKQLTMSARFVEATMAVTSSTEKLAESIKVSGEKISAAVDRQQVTVNDLHKFLLTDRK